MTRENLEECEETGVIICGGGPTGAVLSASLGRMNVPNVVLERESEITTDPRGIALDEDGIRIVQSIGMYSRLHTEIALCQNLKFVSANQPDLAKPPFLGVDFESSDGGTGHVAMIFHKQPELERAIRDALHRTGYSQLRPGCTLTAIREEDDMVKVDYVDPHGSTRHISAHFLVGADGKTGYVRKRYLEPKGIQLQLTEGKNYDETWVALNWQMTLPTPETHPDFPLWKVGYSPELIYDLFFPQDFRFLCNPKRAAVCGRFGPPEDRLWRFEFVILPGEDGEQMASYAEASKIIHPYLTHPGKRYGLEGWIQYPEDCINVLRSRPFHFSARSCNKWALGRVIVAGDAAHVFPPFGGQGIASGFRDAASLAWRLAHLYRHPDADYGKVLRDWYVERKQQFERSLVVTIRNGEFVTNSSPWKAFVRDWILWLLQLSPRIRHALERGPRADGMTKYRQDGGLPFIADLGGGLNIPQVYAKQLSTGKILFTDDLIYEPLAKGIFQLLILIDSSDQVAQVWEQTQGLSSHSGGRVREHEATILIHDLKVDKVEQPHPSVKVARVASGEEFVNESDLCHGRPAPREYDPFRIRREVGQKTVFVILRPDRFVYAACSNADDMWRSLDRLKFLLGEAIKSHL